MSAARMLADKMAIEWGCRCVYKNNGFKISGVDDTRLHVMNELLCKVNPVAQLWIGVSDHRKKGFYLLYPQGDMVKLDSDDAENEETISLLESFVIAVGDELRKQTSKTSSALRDESMAEQFTGIIGRFCMAEENGKRFQVIMDLDEITQINESLTAKKMALQLQADKNGKIYVFSNLAEQKVQTMQPISIEMMENELNCFRKRQLAPETGNIESLRTYVLQYLAAFEANDHQGTLDNYNHFLQKADEVYGRGCAKKIFEIFKNQALAEKISHRWKQHCQYIQASERFLIDHLDDSAWAEQFNSYMRDHLYPLQVRGDLCSSGRYYLMMCGGAETYAAGDFIMRVLFETSKLIAIEDYDMATQMPASSTLKHKPLWPGFFSESIDASLAAPGAESAYQPKRLCLSKSDKRMG